MSHQFLPTKIKGTKDQFHSLPKGGIFLVERRKHPRISVELPFDYSFVEREGSFRGIVEDASEGGLLVYLLERIEIGALLKIEILFSKGAELTTIQAIARVVWSDLATRDSWAEYQYGIQFQSFFKGDFNRLKILLREVGQARG
jgi:c-di-GMP-binding flagellar brake protein YcgR